MASTGVMISVEQFDSAAMAALRPLRSDFGFSPGSRSDYRCRVVSADRWIEATYQPHTHELRLWVGGGDARGGPPLELSDLLRATECPPGLITQTELIQTGDVDVLERLMASCVEYLVRYATSFLRGDPRAFAAAREILRSRSTEYTNQVIMGPAIAAAEQAWREKDFATVARELAPHADILDGKQRRRLAYARRQLAHTRPETAEG